MAIKITTQIGTDRGITDQAYVRISRYEINKYGTATYHLETFLSEDDCRKHSIDAGMYHQGSHCHNTQIGTQVSAALMVPTQSVVKQFVYEEVPVYVDDLEKPIPDTDPVEYEQVIARHELRQVEKDVVIDTQAPDLTEVIEEGFTAHGYRILREKLEGLFGADNLLDC
jgi:hypothetical protein